MYFRGIIKSVCGACCAVAVGVVTVEGVEALNKEVVTRTEDVSISSLEELSRIDEAQAGKIKTLTLEGIELDASLNDYCFVDIPKIVLNNCRENKWGSFWMIPMSALIQNLSITNCGLSTDSLSLVMQYLPDEVESLDVSGNALGGQSPSIVQVLEEYVYGGRKYIGTLDLRRNALTKTEARQINAHRGAHQCVWFDN
jgi:hypothetical protein